MIKFSIITCTYNAGEFLQRTVDSVLAQTYPSVEHILMDGASKDDTLSIIQGYVEKNKKENSPHDIIVHSEPDKGLYDAMNKGIRQASGQYLLFLNAGDVFPSDDTLGKVARVGEEADPLPGVLYGDTDIVDADGNFLSHRRLSPPDHLTWKSFIHGMLVCHQAFYARLDIARQFPYDLKYRHSADVDWCIRVMKEAEHRGLPLVNANVIVANFEEGGDTAQHHQDSLWERFYVMATHYGYIQTVLLHAWFVLRSVLMKLNCYL